MTAGNTLICGNPEEKPATFTRFVFPFAYHLRRSPAPVQGDENFTFINEGREKAMRLAARKKYFTHETSEILYRGTRWFEIPEKEWQNSHWADPVSIYPGGREVEIAMLPPRMVLFEYPQQKKEEKTLQTTVQTGFLLIDLYFPEVEAKDIALPDLLSLNEIFRYVQRPYDGHEKIFKDILKDIPVTCFGDLRTVAQAEVESAYADRWLNLLKGQLYDEDENLCYSFYDADASPEIYKDERSYVWSCALLEKPIPQVNEPTGSHEQREPYHYEYWSRFLNVDQPELASTLDMPCSRFERQWAQERTYLRWGHQQLWYGFSYHSGVMLHVSSPENPVPIWQHFRDMYFDIALLLFYLRVTLFRYSRTIFDLQQEQEPSLLESYSSLRESFLNFSIRYQFPLLSNQQQAIEIYDLARKHFDIDELYSEVEKEIEAAYNFVEMQEARRLSQSANLIAWVGILFMILSAVDIVWGNRAVLATGYNWFTTLSPCASLFLSLIVVSGLGGIGWMVQRFFRRRGRNRQSEHMRAK